MLSPTVQLLVQQLICGFKLAANIKNYSHFTILNCHFLDYVINFISAFDESGNLQSNHAGGDSGGVYKIPRSARIS